MSLLDLPGDTFGEIYKHLTAAVLANIYDIISNNIDKFNPYGHKYGIILKEEAHTLILNEVINFISISRVCKDFYNSFSDFKINRFDMYVKEILNNIFENNQYGFYNEGKYFFCSIIKNRFLFIDFKSIIFGKNSKEDFLKEDIILTEINIYIKTDYSCNSNISILINNKKHEILNFKFSKITIDLIKNINFCLRFHYFGIDDEYKKEYLYDYKKDEDFIKIINIIKNFNNKNYFQTLIKILYKENDFFKTIKKEYREFIEKILVNPADFD